MNRSAICPSKLAKTADAFHFFGVTAQSSLDDLRASYKKKAREAHPDKGGDSSAFQDLQASYIRVKKIIEESKAPRQAKSVKKDTAKSVKRSFQARHANSAPPDNRKRVKVEPTASCSSDQCCSTDAADSIFSEHSESTTASPHDSTFSVHMQAHARATEPCPLCSDVKACGATFVFSPKVIAKGAYSSAATQTTQVPTHVSVTMVDKAIQVGMSEGAHGGVVAHSRADAGVGTDAPKQPGKQRVCDVLECNAPSMNDIPYPKDYFGPVGRRCARHAPTSLLCSIADCGNKAGNTSFCDTDELGPSGLRCAMHRGTPVCNVPFCASEAKTGTTKFTDMFCAPGPRCEVHFGGTRTCAVPCCTSMAFGNASAQHRCRKHGGGFLCDAPNCAQPARCYHVICSPDDFGPPGHRCIVHNIISRCNCKADLSCPIDGCTLMAVTKSKSSIVAPISYCTDHGGELPVTQRCTATPGCRRTAVRDHVWPPRCVKHGGGLQCNVTNCTQVASNVRVLISDLDGGPGFRCTTHGGKIYGIKKMRMLERKILASMTNSRYALTQ